MKHFLRGYRNYSAFVFLMFSILPAKSQSDSSIPQSVIIHDIIIAGNKKTKSQIILREMPFRAGDTLDLSEAKQMMQTAQKNIYNTELFISVDVFDQKLGSGQLIVLVEVKERWYTLPIPYVELADRSFNVWLQKYDADLRRLSYGINLLQQNLTGRNDNLEVLATAGFNRQLKVDYTTPYLTQGMKSRMRLGFSLLGSKELPYISTDSNKLVYHQSENTIRRTWQGLASFMMRREIKKREWITLSMNGVNMFDSIRIYNPDFFGGHATHYVFPELEYKMKFDDVDNTMYPLKGRKFEIILSKRGLGWSGGLNRLFTSGFANFYAPLGSDWFGSMEFRGQVMVPFDQPFYNTKAIGYGNDYIRGYEFYVIDGVASFISRLNLKKKLIYFEVPTFLNSKNYSRIPFTLYGKVFGDAGAAYNRKPSLLGNKLQVGGGFGIDIVTLYDLAVSVNFSLNSLGQTGVYLHRE